MVCLSVEILLLKTMHAFAYMFCIQLWTQHSLATVQKMRQARMSDVSMVHTSEPSAWWSRLQLKVCCALLLISLLHASQEVAESLWYRTQTSIVYYVTIESATLRGLLHRKIRPNSPHFQSRRLAAIAKWYVVFTLCASSYQRRTICAGRQSSIKNPN